MGFVLKVGIVGLPNVGKSTLFNALLKKRVALSANYPFATVEPNVGVVAVPDERLQKLAELVKEEDKMANLPPLVPAVVEFVDIAGLVKGAAEGAGLGNKFLSHIREASIIAHVVRAFEDENVVKEGSVDPKSDYQTINTELMLADLQTLQKVTSDKKQVTSKKSAGEKLLKALNEGISARDVQLSEEEKEAAREFFLLSNKPEIVILNVAEKDYTPIGIGETTKKYKEILRLTTLAQDDNMVVICAKIESDLSELSEEEQKEYLSNLGLAQSGLERLIQKAYETLGLISFLTAGEKEVRAWTLRAGSTALSASGVIHTDFMKKFIKAEVVSFDDFVKNHGWKGAREAGKASMEGRDYVMQDGDVVEFKIGS